MRKARRRIAMPGSPWILFSVLLLLLPAGAAAAELASVSVNPTVIVSGSPLEVTIAFDGPVPGVIFVPLTSDQPSIVDVPSLWVAEGATSWGAVVGRTGAVTVPTPVTIQASYGSVTRTVTVTVTPREPARGVAGDLWADIILGKPDFTEVAFNQVTSRRVFNTAGVLVDRSFSPNRVYVFDSGNSRTLGLSHLGTCQGLPSQTCTANSDCGVNGPCAIEEGRGADLVLGQPSFDRSACNGDGAYQRFPLRAPAGNATFCSMPESQISLSEAIPRSNMAVDAEGNLYVPDPQNNRVLRYDSPFTTDTIADDVWGQADFTGKECNRGRGLDAADNQSLCLPYGLFAGSTAGVAIDSAGNLWIADNDNNRVLRFPKDPGTGHPGHVADLVLGQPDFSSSAEGAELNRMWGPAAVRVNSAGTVYVADSQNSRVLIFDPPLSSGMTGHKLNYDFNAPVGNTGSPTGLELDPAGGLWVNDTDNNQLLLFVGDVVQKVLFKPLPETGGSCGGSFPNEPPPLIAGDGVSTTQSWMVCGSGGSIGIDSDGNVLVPTWMDVWRFPAPIPTLGTLHPADAQIFKPYEYQVQNEVGLAGTWAPAGVAVTASQLIVSDHSRLIFWNDPPNFNNGQTANGYVGTSDPRSQPLWLRFGRIREDGSSHLWAIYTDKIRAYSLPLHTGDAPTAEIATPLQVLGGGSVTWTDNSILAGTIAPLAAGDKVWVADPDNNRVLRIRDALSTPRVDIILGQTSVSGTACNQGLGQDSPSRTSLCSPGGVWLDPYGNLYVSDTSGEAGGNLRLLEYDASLFPDSPTTAVLTIPASRVFGTGGSFTVSRCQPAEICAGFGEAAFTSDGQMVGGGGGYADPPFPYVYTNPLVNQRVTGFLNDYYTCPTGAAFDSSNNLYVTDGCRSRVLIYLNPLSSPPPGPSTLTVTRTGGGTGTVVSNPSGINCGTACSQSYIHGTSVTLSTAPGANSVFAGWSGDADCADGMVTMNNNKTCVARFEIVPDLIVSALTAPTGALAGSTFFVTDTTKNQTGTALASTTRFYLSADSAWSASDTPIGSRSILELPPGAMSSGQSLVTIPAGKPTGNYFIIAKADADLAQTETNENNNTKAVAIRISPPDLIVSAITVPATGGADLPITAANTTKNQANTGPAAASTTKFYLSTNSTLDGNDPEIGTQNILLLAPNASEVHTTTLHIPANTTPGTYYVIAKADADNLITETNNNNNTAFDTIVIGPDLSVSALSVPTTGGADMPINVTDTTKNLGGGPAAASTTNFYLSTNSTLGTGDTLLGHRDAGVLDPGASSAGPTTLTIPAGTPAGSYYILAVADGPLAVTESNENNNTLAALIRLSPDLFVSVFSAPSSAHVATPPFDVTDTTRNQGQGIADATTTSFYLSTNNTWDAGDILLASRGIPILAYNATSPGSTSVTIPAGTAPGKYFILARADAAGHVSEASENNNVVSRAITITP